MDAADLGPFAFIRAEKLRTRRQLLAAMQHNDRTAESGLEHTDPSRPPELVAGHPDAVEAWEAAMASKGLDPTKPRTGAVVAVEWVATASPEWWATASAEQRAAWTADTLAFVADEMAGPARPGEAPEARAERGRGLILAAHYHDDETHIRALLEAGGLQPKGGMALAAATVRGLILTVSHQEQIGALYPQVLETLVRGACLELFA